MSAATSASCFFLTKTVTHHKRFPRHRQSRLTEEKKSPRSRRASFFLESELRRLFDVTYLINSLFSAHPTEAIVPRVPNLMLVEYTKNVKSRLGYNWPVHCCVHMVSAVFSRISCGSRDHYTNQQRGSGMWRKSGSSWCYDCSTWMWGSQNGTDNHCEAHEIN